jgi:hypothetical protein
VGGLSDSCSVRVLSGCASTLGPGGLVIRRDPHPDPPSSEVHRGSSVSGLLTSQLKALLLFTHVGVARAEEDDDVVEHRTERTSANREHDFRLRPDTSERPLRQGMGVPSTGSVPRRLAA